MNDDDVEPPHKNVPNEGKGKGPQVQRGDGLIRLGDPETGGRTKSTSMDLGNEM